MQTSVGAKQDKSILICSACDIPTTRKVGVFLGHAADNGCLFCLKLFPTKFGGKMGLIGANGLKGVLKIIENMECPGSMLVHLLSGKRLRPNLVSDIQNYSAFHTLILHR